MGPVGSEERACQAMFPRPGLCLSPAREVGVSMKWASRCERVLSSCRERLTRPTW